MNPRHPVRAGFPHTAFPNNLYFLLKPLGFIECAFLQNEGFPLRGFCHRHSFGKSFITPTSREDLTGSQFLPHPIRIVQASLGTILKAASSSKQQNFPLLIYKCKLRSEGFRRQILRCSFPRIRIYRLMFLLPDQVRHKLLNSLSPL